MSYDYKLYFKLAEELYAQGDYKKALDIFKKLEKNRSDNDLNNYIGCCYLNLEKYIEAERIFKCLTDSFSNWERPWFNLGRVYLVTKKFEEAQMCFEIAKKINPLSADVNFYMGLYYEKTKNFKEAIKFYNKSASLDSSVECYLNLSNCYYELKEFDLALMYATNAYNADNCDNDAIYNLSFLLIKKKRYIEAYKILCCDLCKNSCDSGILKNLLFSSIKAKDFETAKTIAEKLLLVDPSNRLAKDFLGNTKTDDGSLS